MSQVIYQTGLLPNRAEGRALATPYEPLQVGSADTVEQAIAFVRDQRSNPSCAGQACAACIDAIRGKPPWASAVSIWREARRREYGVEGLERVLEGTRYEYALDGLRIRGWDDFEPGEDRDLVEAGLDCAPAGDDLRDELQAHDHRMRTMQSWAILDGDPQRVATALAEGFGVLIGSGTTSAYQRYRGDPNKADPILTTAHMGGSSGGHGQRIWAAERLPGGAWKLAVQNSWGEDWGGCHAPDGRWQPGCCWVGEDVLRAAWDCICIR